MYSAIVALEGLGADQSIFALIIIHNGVTKDLEYISPHSPFFMTHGMQNCQFFPSLVPSKQKIVVITKLNSYCIDPHDLAILAQCFRLFFPLLLFHLQIYDIRTSAIRLSATFCIEPCKRLWGKLTRQFDWRALCHWPPIRSVVFPILKPAIELAFVVWRAARGRRSIRWTSTMSPDQSQFGISAAA